MATPTVDLDHARKEFDSGGELTGQEMVALKLAIVGDFPSLSSFSGDTDKYLEARDAYFARDKVFTEKLTKCKLKETYGWVGQRWNEKNNAYKHLLVVYLDNPYDGFGKDAAHQHAMYLAHLTDEEVAALKYGQRLNFSGNLHLVDTHVSVINSKITLLEDDPPVDTPTADELKDLKISLGMSLGGGGPCPPDYMVTVDADGKLTFEGRSCTVTKGTVTTTIDSATLAELAYEVKKADFFSLDDKYNLEFKVADFPTYTLTVVMGGQSKTVESYATRPRRLKLLMDRVDQILDTHQWVGNP